MKDFKGNVWPIAIVSKIISFEPVKTSADIAGWTKQLEIENGISLNAWKLEFSIQNASINKLYSSKN